MFKYLSLALCLSAFSFSTNVHSQTAPNAWHTEGSGKDMYAQWCESSDRRNCHNFFCESDKIKYRLYSADSNLVARTAPFGIKVAGHPNTTDDLEYYESIDEFNIWHSTNALSPDLLSQLIVGSSFDFSFQSKFSTVSLKGSAKAIKAVIENCQSTQSTRAAHVENNSGRKFVIKERISQVEEQFLNLMGTGEISKAIDFADLAGINPREIKGIPTHLYAFNNVIVRYNPDVYRYFFQELGLNPNDTQQKFDLSYLNLCKDLDKNPQNFENMGEIIAILLQAGWSNSVQLNKLLGSCLAKPSAIQNPTITEKLIVPLLKAGADPNGVDRRGDPLACLAIRANAIRPLQVLLNAGARLDHSWQLAGFATQNLPHTIHQIQSCVNLRTVGRTAWNDTISMISFLKNQGVDLNEAHYWNIQEREKATLIERLLQVGKLDQARQVKQIIRN